MDCLVPIWEQKQPDNLIALALRLGVSPSPFALKTIVAPAVDDQHRPVKILPNLVRTAISQSTLVIFWFAVVEPFLGFDLSIPKYTWLQNAVVLQYAE